MATHSSMLAWRIPGMEEPGGLLSMGSHRVGHDWSDLAAAAANRKSLTYHGYSKVLSDYILSFFSNCMFLSKSDYLFSVVLKFFF